MPLNASFFHGQIENGQNRFSPSGGWINNNADIAYLLLHSNFHSDPILLLCQFYSFDTYSNVLTRREEGIHGEGIFNFECQLHGGIVRVYYGKYRKSLRSRDNGSFFTSLAQSVL